MGCIEPGKWSSICFEKVRGNRDRSCVGHASAVDMLLQLLWHKTLPDQLSFVFCGFPRLRASKENSGLAASQRQKSSAQR